jgi:hypothetical protein
MEFMMTNQDPTEVHLNTNDDTHGFNMTNDHKVVSRVALVYTTSSLPLWTHGIPHVAFHLQAREASSGAVKARQSGYAKALGTGLVENASTVRSSLPNRTFLTHQSCIVQWQSFYVKTCPCLHPACNYTLTDSKRWYMNCGLDDIFLAPPCPSQ